MKLLGWMHRKFRQNSHEPFKDLIIGNSCDDEHNYPKPNFGNYKHVKQTQNQKEQNLRKSFAGLEDEEYEDESAGAMYELFHGFLAIGTLGSEQVVSDPSTTPTFTISVENITEKEKEDEVTENELKLINDELEKVLGADDESSSCGRNSHVSNGRSSHGSIITLSGKPLEGAESNGNIGTAICPLQGYLFGSAIEMSETTTTVAKKEHRTSLGELFQKTKLAEENFGPKCEKEADKSAMHLMKKMLKKKMLHTSSRSSTSTTTGPVDPASAEKKLHKILHMFHRKVHPENSTAAQKCDKYQKKKTMNDGGHLGHPEDGIMVHPKRALLAKENMRQYYKSQPDPLQFTLGCEDSSENKEHWIKTDADYFVLEL